MSAEAQKQVGSTKQEPNPKQESTEKGQKSPSEASPKRGSEVFDIKTEHQMTFNNSGELEISEKTVDTTLDQFDVEVDHRDPTTKIDRPKASGLMVDDRPETKKSKSSEQANLFAEENQQTLTGKSARDQSLFSDDNKA